MVDTLAQRPYDRTSFVLVVDDDDTLLKFFKIHLNKFFSKVIVVRNAKEALESLGEKEIDIVITDIRMPRMDGFQLLRRIREQNAAIPVILITGAMLEDGQEEEAKELADGYVRKPFSVDDLHNAITHGFKKRDVLKKLQVLIPDNKTLLKLITGKIAAKDALKAAALKEAAALMKELKSA